MIGRASKRVHMGFTLVELLVVIVIIAVLVAVSVAAVLRFRKSADKTVTISNMRQIQAANALYAADHFSRFVPPSDSVEGVWWKNPEFVRLLGTSDFKDLPLSLMDPAVAKKKDPGYDELAGSYAYNTQGMPEVNGLKKGYGLPLVGDPGRTAAFITADFSANGVVDYASAGEIAYRHDDKAIAVYYDGHASPITEVDVTNAEGGATGAFWDANPDDN